MEAKFLASVISFLSIFLAIYADVREFDFETAIYYGDSNVNIGQPFSITCIVPLADPIFWLKDGEPITRHNLRHGRDEHSYTLSESAIEGEKHKIEAHLSVRHALKVHEGKYQCNNFHTSYHMLHVRNPPNAEVPKLQTNSPFIIHAGNGQDLSTLSAYETIHDLTPSSVDDIFTRIWEPDADVASPAIPLPTQTTAASTTHWRQHHQHHHLQQPQAPQQPTIVEEQKQQHKLIYINATNFDGNPSRTLPDSSSSGSAGVDDLGLINLEYMSPTRHTDLTTVDNRIAAPGVRTKYPPMPDFPPPRTTMLQSTTTAPAVQFYTPPHHYAVEHHYHGSTANNPTTTRGYHLETQSMFPLQTAQPTYQHPKQTGLQTLNPIGGTFTQHSNQQLQTYPPQQTYLNANMNQNLNQNRNQQQRLLVPSATTISASTMSFSPSSLSPLTVPTVHIPIRKENDFLVPNYDNAEHQLKVYEIRSPLVLSCNITREGDFELKWEKNGTAVSKVKELNGRYRIIAPERKFIIDRTDIHDDGTYSCVANSQKRDINVVARVVVRVPSNTAVVEGEKLSIACTSVGTDPQLSWSIGNLTISNSTGRYILKPDDNKVQNAILSLENVSLDDRGDFKCIGRNAANDYANYAEASDVSFVRVKGKLAALWPFLGIVAEVLILCAIILIYEKRRNKTELEESDTDQQDHESLNKNATPSPDIIIIKLRPSDDNMQASKAVSNYDDEEDEETRTIKDIDKSTDQGTQIRDLNHNGHIKDPNRNIDLVEGIKPETNKYSKKLLKSSGTSLDKPYTDSDFDTETQTKPLKTETPTKERSLARNYDVSPAESNGIFSKEKRPRSFFSADRSESGIETDRNRLVITSGNEPDVDSDLAPSERRIKRRKK